MKLRVPARSARAFWATAPVGSNAEVADVSRTRCALRVAMQGVALTAYVRHVSERFQLDSSWMTVHTKRMPWGMLTRTRDLSDAPKAQTSARGAKPRTAISADARIDRAADKDYSRMARAARPFVALG
jgi:hypothetical protein